MIEKSGKYTLVIKDGNRYLYYTIGKSGVFKEGLRYIKYNGEQFWGANIPEGVAKYKDFISKAKDKILVGGLGVGTLLKNLKGTDITVVESSKDIIKLVWDEVKQPNIKLIEGDFLEYIKGALPYDYVYVDIWGGINEETALEMKTNRDLLRTKVPVDNIAFWEEKELDKLLPTGITNA